MSGKVVIVTGAAQNNGLGIAERFAAEGAAVAIWDIKGEQAVAEAARLRSEGAKAIGVPCDVSVAGEVEAALARTLAEFKTIDVLINNAGIGGLGSIGDIPDIAEDDFDRVMRVNVKSVFLCSRAVSREMIARDAGGSIVSISSINAVMASPGQLAYATSKGAIWSATKALAVALAPHGIRVNAIAPGSILNNNSSHQHTFSERRRLVLTRIPLGRLGTPADVAGAALFFASDDSGYVTGEVMMLDGGRSCLNYMTDFPFDMEGSRDALAGGQQHP
jgi:NAD(P)-dependent dehydrogenase (short-subunit alcohol dehydrogenase family)